MWPGLMCKQSILFLLFSMKHVVSIDGTEISTFTLQMS